MNPEHLLFKNFQQNQQLIEKSIYAILRGMRNDVVLHTHLPQLNEQLAGYMSYQDDEFYKYLRKMFAGDKQTLKILEFLSTDAKYILGRYLEFFDRYSARATEVSWHMFPKDFSGFSREIMSRFQIEKEYLFPLLQKLRQGMPDAGPDAQ